MKVEVDPGMKWCPGCRTAKPRDGGFHRNRTMHDGLAGWCKQCANSYGLVYGKKYRSQPGYREYKANLDFDRRYGIGIESDC